MIRSWLRSGRLHGCHPGVYAFGRADLGLEGELAAALLLAGPGAALGGLTALWWRDLLHRRPTRIQIDAPGRASSRPGILIRHPGEITRMERRGLPVASLPDALLAAAGSLRPDSLRLVLARAEYERQLDLAQLGRALAGGRRGAAAVRAALDAHLPQLACCASPLEREFLLLCERHRLPLPEVNPRVGRYRPDMLWREAKLIVELDGSRAHGTTAQLAADRRRQGELERLGYLVVRFSADGVRRHPGDVVARLRPLLLG